MHYKELIVWQKSIQLVKGIYSLTSTFPSSEIYGIVSQMRRASVSIPSSLAEGSGRTTRKDYAHFLSVSYGSALELETQLIISKELKYASDKNVYQVELLLSEVLRMLHSMILKIKT